MLGITYDSKDDLLDVVLDRYDHLIRHPTQIVVDEEQGGVASVAVVDADGTSLAGPEPWYFYAQLEA
jgi:uncharacterized protein DUF5335